MTLSLDSKVIASSRQVGADLGEEIILLHLENGQYFGLEQVAATIWRLLESPRTVKEIEDVLLEQYDIDPEMCHAEVVGLLTDLMDQGLVEVTET
jgi:hypothetical protein